MRAVALFSSAAITFLGGCILVYNPSDFRIGADGIAGQGGANVGGTGGTGEGGIGGTGGGGGAGGLTCSMAPIDPVGSEITGLTEGDWNWVGVDGAKCRNGSPTGFAIRPRAGATKLLIFFDGEGACFSAASCGDPNASKDSYDENDFNLKKAQFGELGILNTTNSKNPVKDWNAVAIPYCTGDFHIGTSTNVDVPGGPTNQQFVGYTNVGLYMSRILATFKGMTEVLVTGISSGGFGALFNYDRIARDFCPAPVVLINDSGPPMPSTFNPECLQSRMRTVWGTSSVPSDCPSATLSIMALLTCLSTKYDQRRLGLIASMQDTNAMDFYGVGQSTCANLDSGTPTPLPAQDYAAGLLSLRDNYLPSPPWSSFFVASAGHLYLTDPYYNTTSKNVPLTKWVTDMVNLDIPVPNHVGP